MSESFALDSRAIWMMLALAGCARGIVDTTSTTGNDAGPILGPVGAHPSDSSTSSTQDGAGSAVEDAPAGDDTAAAVIGDDAVATSMDAADSLDAGVLAIDAGGADGGIDAPTDASTETAAGVCPCGPQSVCVSNTCSPARRVFVTSATYDGNLGGGQSGSSGADLKCQMAAASLGGTWMAWVSDVLSSPAQRFSKATDPYRLLDGTVVAADWDTLVSGQRLAHAIDLQENRMPPAATDDVSARVWTGTSLAGATDVVSCLQFGSNDATYVGQVGSFNWVDVDPDGASTSWTGTSAAEPCSMKHHLFCFEQ